MGYICPICKQIMKPEFGVRVSNLQGKEESIVPIDRDDFVFYVCKCGWSKYCREIKELNTADSISE